MSVIIYKNIMKRTQNIIKIKVIKISLKAIISDLIIILFRFFILGRNLFIKYLEVFLKLIICNLEILSLDSRIDKANLYNFTSIIFGFFYNILKSSKFSI